MKVLAILLLFSLLSACDISGVFTISPSTDAPRAVVYTLSSGDPAAYFGSEAESLELSDGSIRIDGMDYLIDGGAIMTNLGSADILISDEEIVISAAGYPELRFQRSS